MKKIFLIIFVFLIFISACSNNSVDHPNSSQTTDNSQTLHLEDGEIINQGEFFRVYKMSANQVKYIIYDKLGNIVFSNSIHKPLTIHMIDASTLDIGIGYGSGITVHQYYHTDQGVFSQEFQYVLATSNGLVAYMDVPEKQSFEKRKIVVQDIFDKKTYYKEFFLDFAQIDTPVISAEFSKDHKQLHLEYLLHNNAQADALLEL